MATDLKIQRGVTSVNANGDTTTLATPVSDISRAFLRMNNNRHGSGGDVTSGSNHEGDDMSLAGYLSDVDEITWVRPTTLPGRDAEAYWEVVEYVGDPGGDNEFIVRDRSLVDMTATNLTDETIAGVVDADRCIPYIQGATTADTGDGANGMAMTAYLTSATNLRVEVGENDAFAKNCHVTTVEFLGSNWSVGHGRVTGQTADTGTIDLVTGSDGVSGTSFDVVDWATAEISSWGHKGDGANQALADNWCRLTPGATTQVDWYFHSNHDGTDDDHVVHVLKHPDLSVSRTVVTHNAAGEAYADVSAAGFTDMALSSLLITGGSSGTGTAYGRGWRSIRLQTLTDAQTFCHRSGNTCSWNIQAINYDGITSDTGGGIEIDTTASVSGGGALSGSVSGGFGRSAVVTGAGVATAAASSARSVAASVAGGGALSGSVSRTAEATAVVSGSGEESASAGSDRFAGGTVQGGGTVSAAGLRSATASVAVSGGGSISSTPAHRADASVAIAGGGPAAASVSPAATASGSVSGGGQIDVAVGHDGAAAAVMSGGGQVSAGSAISLGAAGAVSGGGQVAVGAASGRVGSVAIAGGGSVSAMGVGSAGGSASISGGGSPSASVSAAAMVSGSVSGSGELSGAVEVGKSSVVAVTGGGQVVASVAVVTGSTGSVSGGGSLTASAGHDGFASGSVTGGGTITASTGVSARPVSMAVSAGGAVGAMAAKTVQRPAQVDGGGDLGSPVTAKGTSPQVGITGGGGESAVIVTGRGPGPVVSGGGVLQLVMTSDRSLVLAGAGGGQLLAEADARLLVWVLAEWGAGEAISQWFPSRAIVRWGGGIAVQSWEPAASIERWQAAPCELVVSRGQ